MTRQPVGRRAAPPRVLTRTQARAAGLSDDQIDHRLANQSWRRLLPGVYLTVDTLTWPDRLRAALLHGGPGAMLIGAAALHESEIRIAKPRLITVLVPSTCRRSDARWVHLRRTAGLLEPLQWVGPRRARVERALVDYALTESDLDTIRTVLARAVRSG